MKIEFFHDVLCAWCYAISPRVRKLVENHPEIEIIHRCFALAPNPDSIEEIFGSKEEGKREIMNHWRLANINDDEHRIRADLMEGREFDYPYSMPGLLACKSAEFQGGQDAHWNMFDRIQKAHLSECLNIGDFKVLRMCAEEIELDVKRWEKDFTSFEVRKAVEYDLTTAVKYGITAVPTLVAERRYILTGAQPYDHLERWIESIREDVERK